MKTTNNPLKTDPTRTATLRRQFENEMVRRFAKFRRKLVSLIVDEDAFGLRQVDQPFVMNVFCPTGVGGGVDPTCSTGKANPHYEKTFIGEFASHGSSQTTAAKEHVIADVMKHIEKSGATVSRYDSPLAGSVYLSIVPKTGSEFQIRVADHPGRSAGLRSQTGEMLSSPDIVLSRTSERVREELTRAKSWIDGKRPTVEAVGPQERKSTTDLTDFERDSVRQIAASILSGMTTKSQAQKLLKERKLGHLGTELARIVRETPTTNRAVSSTQLNVTDPECLRLIRELQGRLDPTDVIELETQPHVTVRYGILGQDPEAVRELVANVFCSTGEGGGVDPSCSSHASVLDTTIPRAEGQDTWYHVRKPDASAGTETAPIGEIELSKLVTSQPVIESDRLKPWNPETAPPIEVAKWKGVYYITQGNHRVASALLSGVKTIKARILDADVDQKWVKPKFRQKLTTNSFGPIWMTLGRLSLFQHPDQDVLYLSVESKGLERLNAELGKLPHTDTHDDYVPHLTVAYLKPGTGWKYLSDPSFLEWQSYAFTELTFSDRERQQTEIALNVFCPTGKGGGVDPSCSPSVSTIIDRIKAMPTAAESDETTQGRGREVPNILKRPDPTEVKTAFKKLIDASSKKGKAGTEVVDIEYTPHQLKELLYSTQKNLAESSLLHIVEKGVGDNSPDAFQMDGKLYLRDGNHRVAVAILTDRPIVMRVAHIKSEAIITNGQVQNSSMVSNVFCPTGKGGGVDPSCSLGGIKTADEIGDTGAVNRDELSSGSFKLVEIPIGFATHQPGWVPSGKSVSHGPVIVDVNPFSKDGVELLDGNHRVYEAKLRGEKTIKAYVGNLIDTSLLVQNVRWAFRSSPEKIQEFLKWLEGNLRPILTDEATTEDDWWNKYVMAGFKKGAARSYDDMKKAGAIPKSNLPFYLGQKDEFLKSAFRQPESVEKVKMLAGRVYTELKGVTEAMSQNLTRTLTDGLTQGMNPRQIATNIVKDVNSIGIKRARVIARTEIIRAHAEGQLDSMERLGVKQLAVMVEWNTAGDDRVCKLCQPLEGIVVTVDEAKGLIPRHPQCVVGTTVVSARDVTSLMRTNYTGQIVEVITRKGRRLSVTANHMLLTQYGFLRAGSLYEGLKIFDASSLYQSVKDPDDHTYQTSIADVFASLLEDDRVLAERVPLAPEDLHGDGGSCDSEVCVIRADSVLWDQVEPITYGGVEFCLIPAQSVDHEGRLSLLGSDAEFFKRVVRPSDGSVGRHRELLSLLLSRLLHSQEHGLTTVPRVDPVTLQTFVDRASADSIAFRECVRAHPVLKQLDNLLFREDSPVTIRDYLLSGESQSSDHGVSFDARLSGDLLGGHARLVESDELLDEVIGLRFSHVTDLLVYDVQTLGTFYLADGLINSNCRCAFVPANVGEDQSEQVRGAARIKKAITKSLVAGKPKRGKSKSSWAGANRKISSFRPKSRI